MTLIAKLLGMAEPAAVATSPTESSAGGRRKLLPAELRNYCRILADAEPSVNPAEVENAWSALRECMALVPEGDVQLVTLDAEALCENTAVAAFTPVPVASFYIDRYCVTNEEFADFVRAGGYLEDHLWPTEILPNVLQFVDGTNLPGPRHWIDGKPPKDRLHHPVTGICWYEANAYAHWVGKRLPTPAEWQWSAVWAGGPSAATGTRRYPWGDSFDPSRCNTWNSGVGHTMPVDEYYGGCTPNGVYQLIGNVWEWTASLLECGESSCGDRILTEFPLAEIRGGAFDTYFASQSAAQFRTGQSLLFRGPNIGFRCCISADQLIQSADPYDFLNDAESP